MATTFTADSIDYSLYLVTGRELLPAGQNYLGSLEESLRGGVTVVQIREKNSDTAEFLDIATQSKVLCQRYKVPIIINDRLDIALAIHADGCHLGQTDMPVSIARSLLPIGSIIGVSCNNKAQAEKALEDGADYIGIGAVWGTATKNLISPIIGVRGVGEILQVLDGSKVKCVAIGGINSYNLLRTLHGSVSTSNHNLDGVAIVSDIMGSSNPFASAEKLISIIKAFKELLASPAIKLQSNDSGVFHIVEHIKQSISSLMIGIKASKPLVHQITNTVVANQSANATLALGASPIMATAPQEMEDLSEAIGSLLINFGTISDKDGMMLAGRCANLTKKPVIFDPVGVGATTYRKSTASDLMNHWQASVIKGNACELGALAASIEVQAKGVDSVGRGFRNPGLFVKQLAQKERCVIALTGETDWVSDGETIVKLSNGHKLLGEITGSGCMAGTCIAVFCAAAAAETSSSMGNLVPGSMFFATIGGILAVTIASEVAAARPDVHGPGTFLPALIDELYKLTGEDIIRKAKVEVINLS